VPAWQWSVLARGPLMRISSAGSTSKSRNA